MDRAKSKKIRNIRIIATNIFMCLSVFVIVFVLMMIAMGFTFSESGKLEQAGLAQISSRPSDASVTIDGDAQFNHTDFSKMLSSGTHQIKITKPGYDTWTKDVKIDAGLLTRIDWVRLFPEEKHTDNVYDFNNLRLAAFSANRKKLIATEKNSNKLLVIDIQSENIKADELNLNDCLSTTAAKAVEGEISIIAWNNDNTRLIAKWVNGDETSWHLIDLEHSDASIDLTKRLNLNFSDIIIANDSANKLWALEAGNLRLIDTNNLTISGSFASDVQLITANRDTAIFVNKENGIRQIGIYKNNEKGNTIIKKLEDVGDEATIKLTAGSYWNEDWLAYSVNEQIFVLSGKYPSYDKNELSKLKTKLERRLDYTPKLISTNASQRIAVFSGDKYLTSFDLETDDYFDSELASEISDITWIDNYLLWQKVDDTIVVRDFDGSNRRVVVSDINTAFPVAISENNRWLYYIDFTEITKKDDQPTESKYILKRLSL